MRVELIRQPTADRLHRARLMLMNLFGPSRTEDPRRPRRSHAAFCVSYGRAAFCMYLPEPPVESRHGAGETLQAAKRR